VGRVVKLLLVGFVVFALYGIFININFEEVSSLVESLPSFWPIFLIFAIVSNLFATLAWKHLDYEKGLEDVGFFELFLLRQAGETIGQLNPTGAVGGDFLKYAILKDKTKKPSELSRPLILFRIYSIVSFLIVITLILSLVFYRFARKGSWVEIVIMVILLFLMIFTFRVLKKIPIFILNIFRKIQSKFPNQILDTAITNLTKFKENVSSIEYKPSHLIPILYLVMHWIAGGMEVFALFYLLGESVWIVNAMFVDFGVMVFKSIGQFIPAQAGIEELGNSYMLKVIGLKNGAFWLGFTILRRIRMLFWVVVSLFYMAYNKVQVNRSMHLG
jgi:uncharacterized membrane protein YbhN (UPF0104 family)